MNKSKKITKQTAKYIRPSWDEYFINIAELVGTRGTCDRGRSGSIAVRDRRILATGYVGAPMGMPHCDEIGHEMHTVINDDGSKSNHCIRTIHAEQNVITQAARMGISLDQSTIYCHMTPCYTCAKMIINSGIKRVIASKDYQVSYKSKELFKKADVELVIIDPEIEKYK